MPTVSEHYKNLLAKHYTWMFGLSFEEKVAEQKAILSNAIASRSSSPQQGIAVDLGCGPGFQTIAAAELGFSPVIAIDTSVELLEELKTHQRAHTIETRLADIRELSKLVPKGKAALVLCMGDTLTHLPRKEDVRTCFSSVFEALAAEGSFLITYRDLSSELKGEDRFIPVRSDDEKIMTCFLEYESPETVMIHDLIHLREPDGWKFQKSCYRKLRLSQGWLRQALEEAGFNIPLLEPAGRLIKIVATKP